MTQRATVSFELLFRTPGSGTVPTAQTLHRFRPDPAAMAATQRWLEAHGVTCHAGGYSLSCTAPARVFRSLFGDRRAPRVPADLQGWVEQVSVPPPPELF